MKRSMQFALCAIVAGGAMTACSGMGTTMTRVGRMGQNQGYEMAAELPAVKAVVIEVLKGRGYDVSVRADPENGAEGAGIVVIGQRIVKYSAPVGAAAAVSAPAQLGFRDLANVHLSKKWHMSDSKAVPMITLVAVSGSQYLQRSNVPEEAETPYTKEAIALLRDEIERGVLKAK